MKGVLFYLSGLCVGVALGASLSPAETCKAQLEQVLSAAERCADDLEWVTKMCSPRPTTKEDEYDRGKRDSSL